MQQALRRTSLVPPGFVVDSAFCDADMTVITVRSSRSFGLCPSCGTVSRRVHSHYRRRAADLPLSGRVVQLVVIARRFRSENLDPLAVPGILVAGHAPFAWGKTVTEAVENADVLEYIARLAFRTVLLRASRDLSELSDSEIPAYVSEHHYQRKHGPKATYGQP